jgi:hypothetical protein
VEIYLHSPIRLSQLVHNWAQELLRLKVPRCGKFILTQGGVQRLAVVHTVMNAHVA